MNIQKTLLLRILIVGAVIYGAWNFGLRPKLAEQALLKENRMSQLQLISDSGYDFDTRRAETDEAYRMVNAAGGTMLESLSSSADQRSARDLITISAREFGVDVNRVEPLRVTEFTSVNNKKKRFEHKNDAAVAKVVRFKGEGVRVELEGSFAGIAGFIQQIDQDTQTLKMESFRMVSSTTGRVRMIAQFMKFELVEAPEMLTSKQLADADSQSSGG